MDCNGSPPSRLTRAQWLVLTAAFLGWLFDGFEFGLFPIVARSSLLDLLQLRDLPAQEADKFVGPWNAGINACFLLGAACGGLVFGWLGDRIGRVRALALSILIYSLFTGLSYFAGAPWQLGALRFVGALGMGGEWSLGVALVMECWPERFRPALAGAIGAASNVGFLLVGATAKLKHVTVDSWRWMFLVGALPALLVFFILFFVPESERWRAAVRRDASKPVREILSSGLAKTMLLAVALASVALIGTWGSVQWLPLWADQLAGRTSATAKADTQMTLAIGAILGCVVAPLVGARIGRRPAYFLLCLASLFLCGYMFRSITSFDRTFRFVGLALSFAPASF